MITRVAALLENGEILVGKEKKRHDSLYFDYEEKIFSMQHILGFVDENNNFYNRKEAAQHAFECNQITELYDRLISEDVW